jgi:putative ABC transport system permease protein
LETLWHDFRYALRAAAANPGFTLVAIGTLALGIGANTAVFSAVNGILLKPLPIRDPDRVVVISHQNPAGDQILVSARNFLAFRDQSRSFSALGGFSSAWMNVTGDGEPQQLLGMRITAGLLPLFGVEPMLGRSISPEEDRPGAPRVALLAYNFWRRRYASDPTVLGRTITLNGTPYNVIGVLPRRFRLYNQDPEVWVPLGLNPAAPPVGHNIVVFGRLKPEASLDQARRELEVITKNLETLYPEYNRGWSVVVRNSLDEIVENTRFGLFTMLGAVLAVLLIACSNVASLLLARCAVRRREIAVRIALGAGRRRIVQQLLVESLMLSLAGAAAGVALAWVGLRYLLVSVPAAFPRLFEVAIDSRVLAFSLGLSVVSAILFGIVPLHEFARSDVNRSLKEGGRSDNRSSASATRKALLIAEFAISVVLVIAAALFTRSFLRLQHWDRGFRPERVLSFQMNMPASRYPGPREMTTYYEEILRRIQRLPGVEAAGATSNLPVDKQRFMGLYYRADSGPVVSDSERPIAGVYLVSPGYFEMMRLPVLAGRSFNVHDRVQDAPVVMVSQSFARRWWPGQNPIGRRVFMASPLDKQVRDREVIGVAQDILFPTGKPGDSLEIYMPYLQAPFASISVLVRTSTDPLRMEPAARSEIWAIDRDQAINYVDSLEGRITKANGASRWYTLVLGSLAAIALALSVVGVYGVISYSTAQRTREIGLRMALGALPGDILLLVLREAILLASAGLALGLVAYLLISRLLRSLVYGIAPVDVSTIVPVMLILGVVALVAAWIPAMRATRLDPSIALRDE